jgi:predicted transcriptional regulator YdeE
VQLEGLTNFRIIGLSNRYGNKSVTRFRGIKLLLATLLKKNHKHAYSNMISVVFLNLTITGVVNLQQHVLHL